MCIKFVRANYSTVYGGMIELSNVVRHDKLSTVCRMVCLHMRRYPMTLPDQCCRVRPIHAQSGPLGLPWDRLVMTGSD